MTDTDSAPAHKEMNEDTFVFYRQKYKKKLKVKKATLACDMRPTCTDVGLLGYRGFDLYCS